MGENQDFLLFGQDLFLKLLVILHMLHLWIIVITTIHVSYLKTGGRFNDVHYSLLYLRE